MPHSKPPRPPTSEQFDDSDRAALEELREARRREKIIADHEASKTGKRMESVKSWAVFLGVAVGIKGLLWEPLKDGVTWLLSHLK